MRKRFLKKVIVTVLACSFSTTAFASTLDFAPQMPPEGFGQPPQMNGQHQPPNPEQDIKNILTDLVKDSTITQDQADTIAKTFKNKMMAHKPGAEQQAVKTATSGAYTQKGKNITQNKQIYNATKQNQSAIKVTDGGKLTITQSTINKTGNSTSEEDSNFYGLNAGVLAESTARIDISNTKITTNAEGSNAIFATGKNTVINLSNVKIDTTASSSRGLDATLTGTVNATNVDITTQGPHCAALATDRGNGTINVTGGTMQTAGEGSPGIYSTGDIHVSDATLTATGSEAAVVEGKNTITLNNTTLSGAKKQGVMLYQSFSGDAEVGTSKFTMDGGSLTAEEGPLFYVTNTESIIQLNHANLKQNSGILLKLSADKWGNEGANGATVNFNTQNQILNGDIVCDSISNAQLNLQENSSLMGSINQENTAKSLSLVLDKTSTWNVTANSYLTALTDADSTLSNIADNGFTIYYDAMNTANQWLGNNTYTLKDGGKLAPKN